jgi:hypothetical protein
VDSFLPFDAASPAEPQPLLRDYYEQKVFVPTRAWQTLGPRDFYRTVALYRLRRQKDHVAYLPVSELEAAFGVRPHRFESEVLDRLSTFLGPMDSMFGPTSVRRLKHDNLRGDAWRVSLLNPTDKPVNWPGGKWFLQVPQWWLWLPPEHEAAGGSRWARTPGWTVHQQVLRLALVLQVASYDSITSTFGTKGLARLADVSEKTASNSLSLASELNWHAVARRTGGNNKFARRSTRFLPSDPFTYEEPARHAAGHGGPGTGKPRKAWKHEDEWRAEQERAAEAGVFVVPEDWEPPF